MNTKNETAGYTGGKTSDAKMNFGAKGWRLVIIGMLAFAAYTAYENGLNFVAPAFSEALHVNVSALMAFSTAGGLVSVAAIAIFGAIQKKIGIKKVLLIAWIIFILGGLCWANASNTIMYGIGAILTKAMGATACMLCFAELGANWFPTKKGNYMGVVTVGVVVGAAFGSGPVGTAVTNGGPKAGIMLIVIVSAAVLVLSAFFVKDNPEEAGAYPDNNKDMTPEQAKALLEKVKEYQKTSRWTVPVCLKSKEVWLIGIAFGLLLCMAQGLMAQIVPAAISMGHDPGTAQMIGVAVAPFALVGTILTGILDQKLGTKKTSAIIFILGILSCVLAIVCGHIVIGTLIGFGLVCYTVSGGNNLIMSYVATLWGRMDFQSPYLVALTISQLIAAFGYLMISLLGNATPEYRFAFIGAIAAFAAGLIMILAIRDQFRGRSEEEI